MNTAIDTDRSALARTLEAARRRLLAARVAAGHWEGELSSSALSTATAVAALEILGRRGGEDSAALVRGGLRWLADHQNADGGFGDTADSPSNISTTALAWAALGLGEPGAAFARAEAWLRTQAGDLGPASLTEAIARRYGKDRTFSVPILTMCTLAGRFGPEAWASIPRLPFELAALPRPWFRWLNLQVVSYALPALIAIGQAQHAHRPSFNPLPRLARKRTLRVLEAIQPSSGGFLEATPLTSFVTMALAGSGQADHPVTRKAAAFLKESVRPDGSWAIDTNLATWVTTLSIEALSHGEALPAGEREPIRKWLLGQQFRDVHPYTRSAPGAWSWTDRSGGVPDGDDTPGALLALSHLGAEGAAAPEGIRWLLDLQNRDGGIPTFCRGWGKLPFDRSCPDLTAHALRAWDAWRPHLDAPLGRRVDEAARRASLYLRDAQRADGSWVPLWFGNQRAPGEENPVYGTSRVMLSGHLAPPEMDKAGRWLLSAQNADGGFGGAPGLSSTIEETALAVQALGPWPEARARGCRWLVERTAEGTRFEAAPIGLYFARLWYSEKLYPVIFTVAALGRALRP